MWLVDVAGGGGWWMWVVDVDGECEWLLWQVDVAGGCGRWMRLVAIFLSFIHLLPRLVLLVLGLSGRKPAHKVVNRLITTHLHVN